MPRHSPFYQWRRTIAKHLPNLSKPQVSVLALWTWGMVCTRCASLTTVAVFLSLLQVSAEHDAAAAPRVLLGGQGQTGAAAARPRCPHLVRSLVALRHPPVAQPATAPSPS